jgi:CheY-like chemotaxis protein
MAEREWNRGYYRGGDRRMTRTLRIAIADDEPDVRNYLQVMLPRLGHQVVAAAVNGRELVQMCREHEPDLIIADVCMPEMNGDVAVNEICKTNPTPFILISAHYWPTDVPEFDDTAMRVFLTKPVKWSELKDAVSRFCFGGSGQD